MYRFPFCIFKSTAFFASLFLLTSCGSEVERETPSNGGQQLAATSSSNVFAASSSSQVVASSSSPTTGSEPAVVQKSPKAIIEVQCVNCHMSDIHEEWSSFDEQQWLAATAESGEHLINPANPGDSLFLRRVRFYAASNSNLSLTEEFTTQDYEKLVGWVTDIAAEFVPSSSVSSSGAVSSSPLPSPSSSEAASVSSQAASSSLVVNSSAAPLASSSLSSSSLAQSSVGESSVAFVSSSSGGVSSVTEVSSASDVVSSSDESVSSSSSSAAAVSSSSESSSEVSSSASSVAQLTAVEILNAQCATCHFHTGWSLHDESGWLEAKTFSGGSLITPEDILSSPLLARMSFYGGDTSDMPPSTSEQVDTFTEDGYEVIRAWILTLAEPSSSSVPSSSGTTSSSQLSSSAAAVSSSVMASASSSIMVTMPESSSSASLAASSDSSVTVSSLESSSSLSVSSSSAAAVSSSSESSSEVSSSESSVAQLTAVEILDAQCATCHFHTGWSLHDESGWLEAKTFLGDSLINSEDILSSPLLVRMSFYGDEDSNMPPSNSDQSETFEQADYEVVRAWLLTLAQDAQSSESSESAAVSSSAVSSNEGSLSSQASSSSSVAVSEASSSSSVNSASSTMAMSSSSFSESSSVEVESSSSDVESSSSVSISSVAPESSSSTSSSSSVDSAAALQIIDDFCTSCHFGLHRSWSDYDSDEAWRLAQANNGESYINPLSPEDSFLLSRIKFYGGEDADMPLDNAAQSVPFMREHYETLVAWVKSFGVKEPAPITDGSVAVSGIEFTELGVNLALSCEVDETLQLHLRDPERVELTPIADYLGITSREDGVTLMMGDELAVQMDDGTFIINGEGIDLWASNIFFNALAMPVEDGALDLTLDVLSVNGVEHDFAKVGLLVTDSDDLSGQMVFIHWSGRQGLAEDSGVGILNGYRRIVANPVEGEVTPTPARLRVAYENDTLKIGGCYDCETPAVGLPKTLNFEPKQVYIVASSHTEGLIQARLGLMDAYSDEGKYAKVHEELVTCVNGVANVEIAASGLEDLERLHVEFYRDDSLVAASSVVKEFSEMASCELQDELLEPKLRRLSQTQIKNSIVDIFGDRFDAGIWPDMEDGAKLIGMNNTADRLNVNNLNMERLLETSKAVANTVLASESTVLACAQAVDDTCVQNVVQTYGKRLWRRPLSAAEVDEFAVALADITGNESQLEFAINALFMSANFLFRSEIGVLENNAQALTNYEIVSILSYAVLNTTPDDILLTLADDVSPLSAQELQQQVARLLEDDRANAAMMEVYKDYLKLDLVLSRPKDDSFNFTDTVRADVLASAEQMLIDNIASGASAVGVFGGSDYYLNSNIDYLFNADVEHAALTKTTLDATERSGVLNHPAFLSVHSTLAKSGIVKRGVFALEQLLCQELPDPPDDVMPVPVPDGIDVLLTSERNLLQMTHSAQAACISCHQVIDPAGFGFENFDSIGRYRTVEKNVVAIDASGVLDNVGEHVLMYSTSAEYSEALMASPQMSGCVSRRFLENFLGQDLERNACELEKYQHHLSEGDGSVSALLSTLIQLESFGKRKQGQ